MTLAEFQPQVDAALTAHEWATARAQHGASVTADMVPRSPLRRIPMDLVTTAVVRRLLRLPATCPILSLKVVPSDGDVLAAVTAIAVANPDV